MHPPDALLYNSSPEYIRGLIAGIPLSQRELARRLGVSDRYLRALVAGSRQCSYPVQYCLEMLVLTSSPAFRPGIPESPDPGGASE